MWSIVLKRRWRGESMVMCLKVKDTIPDYRNFLGLLDVDVLYVKRRAKFLRKTRVLSHADLHSLTTQFY